MNELRFAVRQIRRQPGFALAIIATLALTIGANTTVFSVVDAVLIRGLPYEEPEQLMWVTSVRSDHPEAPFTLPEYMDYREQTRTMASLAAYANWSASIAGEGMTERFQGARMSANAFQVLGVRPAAGRLLQESDDRPDAPSVAVLSHRLWERQFGSAPEAIGSSVRINGEPYVIAGVLPRHFPLPLRDIDVIVPLGPDRDPLRHVRNSVNFLRFFGRLKPGATAEQAQNELTGICRALRRQFPSEYARKESVAVRPLQDELVGDFRKAMLLLLASVIVVLAVALGNLLSLMLVRINERRAEMSVRIAIGAARIQLVRQLTIEALVLTFLSGIIGLLLAIAGARVAIAFAPASIPRLSEVAIDARSMSFALMLTIAATLLLSAAPIGAVLKTRAALGPTTRGVVGDRWNHRVRNAMVIGEISAALVLLLATTVLVQSLLRLQGVHPGFRPEGVFQARISLPPNLDVARFHEELARRINEMPGVESAGVISVAPMSGLLSSTPFTVDGKPPLDERETPSANLRFITSDYLTTVGTRLLRGRGFSQSDRADSVHVALISEALAAKFLTGEPLGQRLMLDDNNDAPRPVEIIGIVENVRQTALDGPPSADIYLPLPQVHPDWLSFLRNNQFWMIKTSADPAALRGPFLKQLRIVNPDVAISSTGTMSEYLEASLAPRRFTLGLFVAFSLTAILLAVSGLYGLVSYSVSQRERELGLRLALGATAGDVQKLILRQAARLAVTGTALGIGMTLLVARFARETTFEPASLLAMTALLCAVVTMAAWLPARRAARVEPALALKAE